MILFRVHLWISVVIKYPLLIPFSDISMEFILLVSKFHYSIYIHTLRNSLLRVDWHV